ncbi:MAG: alpha/beta fold hydrolase [Bdellovibrionota bacterium]
MKFDIKGNPNGPIVVCIHGLMGAPDDFRPFIEAWGKEFKLLIPELADIGTNVSGYGINVDGKERLIYEFSAPKIIEYLQQNYPGKKPFFAGISYGGKITIQIAETYPEFFGAGVVTDVGVGPLGKSSGLFKFVFEVVPKLNFNQPWKELRKDLKKQIPDPMLRILIQSHIHYDSKDAPSGTWKGHAYNFDSLLKNSRLENQWGQVDRIQAPIYIFKATEDSAIDENDYSEMQKYDCFKFITLEGANHFIQINNCDDFRDRTLALIEDFYEIQ